MSTDAANIVRCIMPEMFDNITIFKLLFLILSLGKYVWVKILWLEHVLCLQEQQATGVVSEFEYVEYYGQALEQPVLHTPDMDFSSCGYGTWVPTVQADTGLHNYYMGPIVEDNFQLQPQLNPYER